MKEEYKLLVIIFIILIITSIWHSDSYSQNAYSEPTVLEDITFDPESKIYTYTYTITNLARSEIWWWGIWYKSEFSPVLDDSTVDEEGFAPTDTEDCSQGWKNTAPERRGGFYIYAGPGGEAGFFSTYTSDFTSQNPPNIGYIEGGAFYPLDTIEAIEYTPEGIDKAISEGKIQESDKGVVLVGSQFGWQGENAKIITTYGIQYGNTGYYVIRSSEFFPGPKHFFYNTTDYWNSYYDYTQEREVIGGFEAVSVTDRNYYKLGVTIHSSASVVDVLLQGIDSEGYSVEHSLRTEVIGGEASVDMYVLDYGTYTLTASADGYVTDEVSGLVIDDTNKDQQYILTVSESWVPRIVINRKKQKQANTFEMELLYFDKNDVQWNWPVGFTVELKFYAESEDQDQNGSPDFACADCWNEPDGELFSMITSVYTGKKLIFSLPSIVNEETGEDYHMTDFSETNEWGIAFSFRVFDNEDNLVRNPSFYQFRVKKTQPAHPPIAETQIIFESDEIPQKDISVTGNWSIDDDEEEYTIESKINLSTMDTKYLQKTDGEPVALLEEELTIKLEIIPREEDPDSLITSIFFADSMGNPVEYNPIDPETGTSDPTAPPITYDIPLHKKLQKLYRSLMAEEASSEWNLAHIKTLMARDPDNDFIKITLSIAYDPDTGRMQRKEKWRPKQGKYGVYYISGGDGEVRLFRPEEGEHIDVIVTPDNILMARITARHTSQWYMEESTEPMPAEGDGKEWGCFIGILVQ
ncbi:MAG: hypothetical protein ACMUJM_07500 [bacterium]